MLQNPSNIPAELQKANVTLIVDALAAIGLDPQSLTMTAEIKPLSLLEGQTIIGHAITTKWEVGRGRMTAESVKKFVFAPLDEAARNSVWVVGGGTDELYSLFGDIIAMACKRNGMAGAVTDNACRDIAAIREIQFPVFARSAVPYGPGDAIRPVAANEPIVCGGSLVEPGDLVAADIDGVIVIPGSAVADLTDAVSKRFVIEAESRSKINEGRSLVEAH